MTRGAAAVSPGGDCVILAVGGQLTRDDRRRILAMGGGGLHHAGAQPGARPAGADPDRQAGAQDLLSAHRQRRRPRADDPLLRALLGWPCEPSILSLFHLGRDRIDPATHLLAQDAIYVGGGSMRNMLAVWREHGVDEAMRRPGSGDRAGRAERRRDVLV